jgi:hypothetical protein
LFAVVVRRRVLISVDLKESNCEREKEREGSKETREFNDSLVKRRNSEHFKEELVQISVPKEAYLCRSRSDEVLINC